MLKIMRRRVSIRVGLVVTLLAALGYVSVTARAAPDGGTTGGVCMTPVGLAVPCSAQSDCAQYNAICAIPQGQFSGVCECTLATLGPDMRHVNTDAGAVTGDGGGGGGTGGTGGGGGGFSGGSTGATGIIGGGMTSAPHTGCSYTPGQR